MSPVATWVPVLLLFGALLAPGVGGAVPSLEGTYAIELDFTNPKIYGKSYGNGNWHALLANWNKMNEWGDLMSKRCQLRKDCRAEKIWKEFSFAGKDTLARNYGWKISYDSGLYFEITVDPGVVEVKLRTTASQVRAHKKMIQSEIFDAGRSIGLRPMAGECHLNTGLLSNFGHGSPQAQFRRMVNKLVDGFNHQEFPWLFMVGTDFGNAPPVSILRQQRSARLREIIARAHRGEITDIVELAKEIREKVYDITSDEEYDKYFREAKGAEPPSKYQMLNIESVKSENSPEIWRTEHRAAPAPRNAEDLEGLILLEDGRNRYLNSQDGWLVLQDFDPKMSRADKVARFRQYVEESGLDWNRYQHLVRRHYRQLLLPRIMPAEREAGRRFIAGFLGGLRYCLGTTLNTALGHPFAIQPPSLPRP